MSIGDTVIPPIEKFPDVPYAAVLGNGCAGAAVGLTGFPGGEVVDAPNQLGRLFPAAVNALPTRLFTPVPNADRKPLLPLVEVGAVTAVVGAV